MRRVIDAAGAIDLNNFEFKIINRRESNTIPESECAFGDHQWQIDVDVTRRRNASTDINIGFWTQQKWTNMKHIRNCCIERSSAIRYAQINLSISYDDKNKNNKSIVGFYVEWSMESIDDGDFDKELLQLNVLFEELTNFYEDSEFYYLQRLSNHKEVSNKNKKRKKVLITDWRRRQRNTNQQRTLFNFKLIIRLMIVKQQCDYSIVYGERIVKRPTNEWQNARRCGSRCRSRSCRRCRCRYCWF